MPLKQPVPLLQCDISLFSIINSVVYFIRKAISTSGVEEKQIFNMRRKPFTARLVKDWHRLSREVVFPSLEIPKVRLDRVLSKLMQWKISLLIEGRSN